MRIRSSVLPVLTAFGIGIAPSQGHAQIGDGKFSLHGYLNQGYAVTDRYPMYGITKDGTTDYRTAALQGRYQIDDNDHIVLQLRNRRIGENAVDDGDVTLDWAYYQHDFGIVQARVGRGPIPLGLYNEIRSVGTLLPFYRAPGSFYLEGIESIDGLTLTNRLVFGAWNLETTVYGGGIGLRFLNVLPSGTVLTAVHTENNAGVQIWLNTPLQGLRIGAGALRFRVPLPTDTTTAKQYIASVDATFDRFFVRGEYKPNYEIVGLNERQNSAYAQAGVKLTEQLSVNGQVESSNVDLAGIHTRYAFDRAVSFDYRVQPNVVVKIEGHRNNGFNYDVFVAPTGPAPQTNYGIASVAVSF